MRSVHVILYPGYVIFACKQSILIFDMRYIFKLKNVFYPKFALFRSQLGSFPRTNLRLVHIPDLSIICDYSAKCRILIPASLLIAGSNTDSTLSHTARGNISDGNQNNSAKIISRVMAVAVRPAVPGLYSHDKALVTLSHRYQPEFDFNHVK